MGVLAWAIAGAALGASQPADASRPSASLIDSAVAIPVGADPIKVDGEIAEEIWTKAPPITEFLQRDPTEGARPTRETEARVVFDAAALYVAVRALEPDASKIVGHLTRRDENSPSDWIRVMVDSYRDRRTAYEFAVNAAGVKQDRYWFNDTNSDTSWDAVWDVAVAKSPQGWRAEFRIPFSQLRFNPAASSSFGFAIVRTVAHANETSTWPLLARSASGYVSSFGELTGLTFASAQKRLELAPYVVGQVKTAPVASANPLVGSPDPDAAVGLDLKYKVAPGLTLTGTVNPDFGQVEADPAVVNLGAFETFFAERRPFFVEGSGNFSFDLDCSDGQCTGLFYSRRIGRAPHRVLNAPNDGYVAQPANSTIVGAAKLTGRVGHFAIGALNAITTREDAHLASGPALDESTSPVEPFTSYSVVRANREFANRSRLGFIVTSTNRASDRRTAVPARHGRHGRHRRRLAAPERPLQPHRILGGQHGARRRGGDRSPAAEQRPQFPAAGRRPPDVRPAPDPAQRSRGRGQLQQDQRRAHARQLLHRIQVARLRRERPGLPVARRRHLDQ